MTGKSAKVIVLRKLPAAVEARMAELFDVEFNNEDRHLDKAEIASAMARADVLVSTVTDRIDAELIETAGDQLKLIANFGNGVDNIDVDAVKVISRKLKKNKLREYCILEASGGIDFNSLEDWNNTDIEVISSSKLNRGVNPIDLSLLFEKERI